MKVLIMNGPNLNMLGTREPQIYGSETLRDIEAKLKASASGHEIEFFQSNHEGALIDRLQKGGFDALIINAGALTHYSYSLSDALKSLSCKKIELHISNVFAREPFRAHSVLSPVVDCVICGLGTHGYFVALDAIINE